MSRNVRPKLSFPQVKSTKRRGSDNSSSLDLSDDSGYSAVEDISDSDEDEEDVEAAEEEHLITAQWRDSHKSSPRPVDDEDEDGDDEEDSEEDDEDDVDDASSWSGFADEPASAENSHITGQDATVVERRVRFDIPDSEGDTTDDDDDITGADQDFFPDIFVEQDSLAPSFRRALERDDPDDDSGSDQMWDIYDNFDHDTPLLDLSTDVIFDEDIDVRGIMAAAFDDDSTPVATPGTSQDLSTAISTPVPSPEKAVISSSDEFDDDNNDSDGDTTEEEDPPSQPIPRKTVDDAAADSGSVAIVKSRPGAPRTLPFNLSHCRKPVVIANPKTRRLMIFTTPQRQLDLSPDSFNLSNFALLDGAATPQSANVMMSSVLMSSFPLLNSMDTQFAIPEAFFPRDVEPHSTDSSDEDVHIPDESEEKLALDDFISWGDDSSVDGDANADDDDDDEISLTPARGNPESSPVTSLLRHFDSNPSYVGAFRREQANHQLITKGKATRESLNFSSPYIQGTLRGIKDGHIQNVNTPISPLRKQKNRPDIASSPLAGVSQKRKASAQSWGNANVNGNGHKRQRSIPDIPLTHQP